MNSQTKENEDYELIRFELDGVVAQFRLRLGRRVSIFIWVFGAYYAYAMIVWAFKLIERL